MLGKTVQQARTNLSQRSAVLDMRRRFANAALAVSSAIESDTFIRDQPGPAVEFRQRFSESAPRLRYFKRNGQLCCWTVTIPNSTIPHAGCARATVNSWIRRFRY